MAMHIKGSNVWWHPHEMYNVVLFFCTVYVSFSDTWNASSTFIESSPSLGEHSFSRRKRLQSSWFSGNAVARSIVNSSVCKVLVFLWTLLMSSCFKILLYSHYKCYYLWNCSFTYNRYARLKYDNLSPRALRMILMVTLCNFLNA